MLFSHPKDYTPVCTTELGVTARLKGEFDKRGVKVIGLSVDSLEDHVGWKRDIEQTQGATVDFPMIADPQMQVAQLYGMIHPNASDRFTVRSVFVIDPNRKIRSLQIGAARPVQCGSVQRAVVSQRRTDASMAATATAAQIARHGRRAALEARRRRRQRS